MIEGYKCNIQCQCFLPQYKKMADPPLHQFIVFIVVEDSKVQEKLAQCNNCGVIHKILDVCRSEIITGKDSSKVLTTIDDVKATLGSNIVTILESNEADLATWEMAQFIIDHEQWGSFVVLATESDGKVISGKIMKIMGQNLARVEKFSRNEVM